jgi:capsular exopolysaccharide synthesis family protein
VENNSTGSREESVDIRRYIGLLISYWWLMVLLPVVGGLAGYYYSDRQDPVYEAKGTILVQYRGSGLTAGSDFGRSDQLAATYQRLITAKPFLDRVAEREAVPLSAGRLSGSVSASVGKNPPLINVRARASDPGLARETAQAVAEEFIDYAIDLRLAEIARVQSVAAAQGLANLQGLTAAQVAAVDSLQLLEDVTSPGSPVYPKTRQNVILGVILGVMLAGAVALALESMKDTVRFPDQISGRFGVTSLGTIFKWSDKDVVQGDLVIRDAPSSGYAEAVRQIRANLQFATANIRGNAVLVSSPAPGEGKSTIIANLALAVAQTGKRVIVVDGDLRRPSIHKLFSDVSREPGLSNYLADLGPDFDAIVTSASVGGVSVIPSGPTPPNPAELLGSPRMVTLLDQLRNEYDMVFVDSPPILPVADGTILASELDAVIVVVDAFATRSGSLDAALAAVRHTNVPILGVVVNKLRRSRFGYDYQYPYYQHYYSSYRRYYAQPDDEGGNVRTSVGRLKSRAGRVLSRFKGAEKRKPPSSM